MAKNGQKTQKDKKGKKGKKVYSTQKTFEFFNTASSKTLRKQLVTELNKIADQYGADHIDLKKSPPYPDLFSDPFWSWRSSFFIKYLEQAEEYKASKLRSFLHRYVKYPKKYKADAYANRYWLDCLIRQCGYMVWNLVQKHHMVEWKKTDVVPENPLSKRKGGNSIEAVADHFAEKELAAFEENFK